MIINSAIWNVMSFTVYCVSAKPQGHNIVAGLKEDWVEK